MAKDFIKLAILDRELLSDCARVIRAERDSVRFDGYRYRLAMRWVDVGLRYIQVTAGRQSADNYIQDGACVHALGPNESVVIYNMMKRAYDLCNRTITGDGR